MLQLIGCKAVPKLMKNSSLALIDASNAGLLKTRHDTWKYQTVQVLFPRPKPQGRDRKRRSAVAVPEHREEALMDSLSREQQVEEKPVAASDRSECEVVFPSFRPAPAANDLRMTQLVRTIEHEIIPRLMLAHRDAASKDVERAVGAEPITDEDVRNFAKLVLSEDEYIASSMIDALRLRGTAIETIYVDLLGPTARYLGELWEEDLCTITDVTVGLGRLQRVLRELSPAFSLGVGPLPFVRRILLLPSPGEQHTFGLVMVSEFFRKAGWDVVGGPWAASEEAASLVAAEWFDVIGFSVGADVRLEGLTAVIQEVRQSACNREMAVLVGGPIFAIHPEYAERVGADGMTIDGTAAPIVAERLIARNLPHSSPSPRQC